MPPSKRKNPADNWLPPRVYRGKSAYEWHPRHGGAIKLTRRGEETPELKAKVWAAYNEAVQPTSYTINDMLRDFHYSPRFARLSVRTQKDYDGYSKRIARVFGHMAPTEIKPTHIRAFMDKLGTQYAVAANRHHSYLSVLFAWGVEYDKCATNPAKAVRKFPENPRDRYIEDWEHDLYKKIARNSGAPYMAPASDIAYLCRLRGVELKKLTEFDITDAGIFIERAKGSENELTQWSARLYEAVKEARTIYPDAPTSTARPLFHTRKGTPFRTLKSAHSRIMQKCLKAGLKTPFHFHDFKAKGITDHTQHYGGHASKKMAAVYNRKPKPTEPTR